MTGPRTPERISADEQEVVWTLVHAAQQGDSAAFGRLYRWYRPRVQAYVFAQTGEYLLAEDIASETFVRAFSALRGLRYQGKDFASWLITIARNLIIDHRKSAARRYEVMADLRDESIKDDCDPADLLDRRNRAAALWRLIRDLPRAQRECVILRFVLEWSVDETAEWMQKNAPAIRALQYRAVHSLARAIRASESPVIRPVPPDRSTDVMSFRA